MATHLQNLRQEFLSRFAEELGQYGFARKGEDFARKTAYGRDLIQALFVAHPGKYFEVDLSIGVRHDAVESIVNPFTPRLDRDRWRWTKTVGNRLDNMLGRYMSWRIADERELESGLRRMMDTLRVVAFPFFDRFSLLPECLKVLLRDDDEGRQFYVVDVPRAMAAVAAAFVLGDRKVFDEVVEYKTRFLKKFCAGKPQLELQWPEFIALVEDLKRR